MRFRQDCSLSHRFCTAAAAPRGMCVFCHDKPTMHIIITLYTYFVVLLRIFYQSDVDAYDTRDTQLTRSGIQILAYGKEKMDLVIPQIQKPAK